MNDSILFNLEEIKKAVDPIDKLQGKLNSLDLIHKKWIDNYNNIIESSKSKDFINNIQEINDKLEDVNKKILKITNENVNKFLVFQDELITNYKESFKKKLMRLRSKGNFTKDYGLFLIENKKISRIIDHCAYVPAVNVELWLELLDSLKLNSIFLLTIKKIGKYYDSIINDWLNNELTKIAEDTNPLLINDYKRAFLKEPMTFSQYQNELESNLTQEELDTKKDLIEKTKEKEKLIQLKKKQEEQQKSYDEYLKLSHKEFQRRRRKKKREKLPEFVPKLNDTNELEISEEISEKIEKFKSKFENSFEEKYLIQRDEDTNPLDVIRERKKQKDEEYKDYIKKFKNNKE